MRSGADWQVRRVAKDAIGYAGPSLPKNNVPVPLTTLVDHLRRVGCVARVAVGAPTICVHPRERAMASSGSDFVARARAACGRACGHAARRRIWRTSKSRRTWEAATAVVGQQLQIAQQKRAIERRASQHANGKR